MDGDGMGFGCRPDVGMKLVLSAPAPSPITTASGVAIVVGAGPTRRGHRLSTGRHLVVLSEEDEKSVRRKVLQILSLDNVSVLSSLKPLTSELERSDVYWTETASTSHSTNLGSAR
jgi:hypothetical protein